MADDISAEAPDLLNGMPAIAAFVGLKVAQARHLSDRGILPTFKLDGYRNTCARRSTLTAWLAAQEARSAHRPKPTDPKSTTP